MNGNVKVHNSDALVPFRGGLSTMAQTNAVVGTLAVDAEDVHTAVCLMTEGQAFVKMLRDGFERLVVRRMRIVVISKGPYTDC